MAHYAPPAGLLPLAPLHRISAEPSPIRTVTVGFGFAPNLSPGNPKLGAGD
jgi:hypothetical protein